MTIETATGSPPLQLVVPEHKLPKAPNPPPWDQPLKVRYVRDFDWLALAFNLATLAFIAACIGAYVRYRISEDTSTILAISLLLSVIPALILWIWGKFFTSPDNLQANVYLNKATRRISIYPSGWHAVPWPSKKQSVIGFEKKEIITFCQKDGTALKVPCGDGRFALVSLTLNYNVVDFGGPFMGNTLRYSPIIIRQNIQAALQSRLGDLFGKNRYDVLIANWDRVELWTATGFGGQAVQTAFEKWLNIQIDDPLLNDIDLDPQSKKVYEKKSEMLQVQEGAQEFIKLGVKPKDALTAARSIVQTDADNSFTVIDAEGVRNLAYGSGTAAVATSGGGSGRNRPRKNKSGKEEESGEE